MARPEIPEALLALKRAAWTEQQAGALTVPTAVAVQQAYTEHAKTSGESRMVIEMETKRLVRHGEGTSA